MLRSVPRFVWLIILVLAVLKLVLQLSLNPGLEWNYDERRNGRIADNYLAGRGYVSLDPVRQQLRPDSFHASFPVFVYIGWQQAGLPKHYFTLLVYGLSVAAYILGILYLHRTLLFFGVSPPWAWAGALAWAVYPSAVYYIGAYMWYENLALPLLIWVVYKLLRQQSGRPQQRGETLLVAAAVTVSCLLRGYLLAVYGVLFAAWLALTLRQSKPLQLSAWRTALLTLALLVAAHAPILLKNHRMFGAWTLSNQAGFELLQGHNSVTQGRFMFDWDEPAGAFDQFVRAHIPRLDSLDQYQESRARAALAQQWVRAHPTAEARLWLRKTLLFFSPENFIADAPRTGYNPVTASVHGAFLLAVLLTLVQYRGLYFRRADVLLLTPLLVVWLLSLVFFVGFRWRYFAEPALLLYPLIVWQRLRDSSK
ncbi:hypothetical protein [Hymenobacter metallicola]|uniref:Glycosyltransferase RgtA/B/C/D-like domain-containing protein n=1 Tax=Hymenobacter metallicola TaxID=2563114 RepID=A0A4Z0QA14_9BACT|nr:hypothetical protein [Hymenobacter metallicola]TGE26554.1 hypothetical protein E5K02_17340 [Hymenobacter metallicola]